MSLAIEAAQHHKTDSVLGRAEKEMTRCIRTLANLRHSSRRPIVYTHGSKGAQACTVREGGAQSED